jgi:predicted Rossmann fold flavoprotein
MLVLEKMPSCGRKLLITGAGQCNLTHTGDVSEFISHYGDHGSFLRHALREFSNTDLIRFCEEAGVQMEADESGKIFPASRRASDVLAVLLERCRESGVAIRCNEAVQGIESMQDGYRIVTAKGEYRTDTIVIATGGSSYPGTGSSGDGYALARSLAHTITPLAPALAAVTVEEYPFADLAGISFPDLIVSLYRDGRKVREGRGDLLLTHTGLSGPVVLHLSRFIEPGDLLTITFGRERDVGAVRRAMIDAIDRHGTRQIASILGMYSLPERFATRLLELSGIPNGLTAAHLPKDARDVLIRHLTASPFHVRRLGGYNEAMVTRGGVALGEINPRTMESRIHPGLYCIGEVLDIDGDTGGYNLQAAFSSGVCAARHIASHTRA